LNRYVDEDDYHALTKKINAKQLHYEQRVAITQNALAILRRH